MDWRKLVLAFFYSKIRGFAQQFIGTLFGLPVDLIFLAIGWWKSKEWWGETLAISSATLLGYESGEALFGGIFRPQTAPTTTPAPAPTLTPSAVTPPVVTPPPRRKPPVDSKYPQVLR